MADRSSAIVWIFDSGAEGPFPISLYSLQLKAPRLCERSVLVVIDCGLSDQFRAWLSNLRKPRVHIVAASLPLSVPVVGVSRMPAAAVMRLRIELPLLLSGLIQSGELPKFEQFMQLDTDTAFLSEPGDRFLLEWESEDIQCCYEWDWVGEAENDVQSLMKFIRPSSFIAENYIDKLPSLAEGLDMTKAELHCIPTVNSGVWVARVGSNLSTKWVASYNRYHRLDEALGPGLLNPYSAEQNALSLAIYRGEIVARLIPRRYNHLPPRAPWDWPPSTVIAHFVTFLRNWNRPAFRAWSAMRRDAIRTGFVPSFLAIPSLLDP
jgi:hypothetical protein